MRKLYVIYNLAVIDKNMRTLIEKNPLYYVNDLRMKYK